MPMPTPKKTTIQRKIGANVLRHREGKAITQQRLGELAGFSDIYIGLIERGQKRPTLEALAAIAKALGVTVSDITKGV
jgi:transcriptional regulator with XRE-family HTH domain